VAQCPIWRGTVDFQREPGASTNDTKVLHVSRLGMNLISVSQLQDRGYDVHFVKKKVFVKHPSSKRVRQMGVQSNRL